MSGPITAGYLIAHGLVLYPHFQPTLVPGWLDKRLTHRHRASSALDNVVVLAPRPEWIARLPGGKLPDREDFKTFADDVVARQAVWRRAIAESSARNSPPTAAALAISFSAESKRSSVASSGRPMCCTNSGQ